MYTAAKSIHRSLLSRIAVVAVLLAVIEGGWAYLYARRDIAAGISEHAALGTEALKALIAAKLENRGGSWKAVVGEALEDLGERPRLGAWGTFVAVEVNDSAGRVVGRSIRDPTSVAVTNALPPMPDENAPAGQPRIRLGSVSKDGDRNLVPVLVAIVGTDGLVDAYVRGVYEVSNEAVARLQRRTFFNSMMVVLAVLSAAIAIFPIVRSLTGGLMSLSSQLLDANLQSLRVLGNAIAKRDSDTDAHNYRVTVYSVRLAEQAGLGDSEVRALIKGAFLHDVGKIGTPDSILLKPGKLDADEFAEMKRHVVHGQEIVAGASWLQDAAAVVAYHHEKFDGCGYQEGISGTAIPIAARIFCIADVFDALTSERPYKKPFSLERSLQILREGSGNHFDPLLLKAFEEIAEPLYLRFANRETAARHELDGLINRYFRQDLGAILKDVPR